MLGLGHLLPLGGDPETPGYTATLKEWAPLPWVWKGAEVSLLDIC